MKIIGNKYRIIKKVGSGGMGDVHLAEVLGSHGFKKKIAVKILPERMCRDRFVRESFVNEATILSKLSHPNLVKVFDFGITGERLYLCMEYIEGFSLRELIKGAGRWGERIPEEVTVKVFEKIFEGLAYMHEKMIIHGDLSPKNIMLGINGEVKILDFGLSRVFKEVTLESPLGGKKGYTAPEVISTRKVYPASDIYAAGLIMGEMLEDGLTGCDFSGKEGELLSLAGPCVSPNHEERPGSKELLLKAKAHRRNIDTGFELKEYMGQVEEELSEATSKTESFPPVKLSYKKKMPHFWWLIPAIPLILAALYLFTGQNFSSPGLPAKRGDDIQEKAAVEREMKGEMIAVPTKADDIYISKAEGEDKFPRAIDVRSHPEGATVYIDGVKLGVTPLTLPPKIMEGGGDKMMKLTLDGFEERAIELGEMVGDRKKGLFFTMNRSRGVISLNANPWAVVLIDGKRVGTTPIIELEIYSGEHVITFENEELGVRLEKRVQVSPGTNEVVVENLMNRQD